MTDEPRTPPEKIRVTKLQEAQVVDLVKIEQDAATKHAEAGIAIDPLDDIELAKLPRSYDVLVAEADHEVAGYLAWADHPPGVAWVPILAVAEEYQRFGVGTRLLRELGESASEHGVEVAVTPCWERAGWAMTFLGAAGFQPIDGGKLPPKLEDWRNGPGAELAQPGQKLWWAKTDGLGTVPGLPRPSSR
jgi:amino-acid N-acetyltransferase